MLLFSSRNATLKSDLEWILQQKTNRKTVKIFTVVKLSSFESIQNRRFDSKCELRSVFKELLEKLTEPKEKFF